MRFLFYLSVIMAASACSSNTTAPEEAALPQSSDLVGSWASTHVETDVIYAQFTYLENNTYCAFLLQSPRKDFPGSLVVFRGNWRMEGNLLYTDVTSSNSPAAPVGFETIQTVQAVDRTKLVIGVPQTGGALERFAVSYQDPEKICHLEGIANY